MTLPATILLRRKVGRVRVNLSEALVAIDSREVPQDALRAIADAHHALTEAIARLKQVEASYHLDEDDYA